MSMTDTLKLYADLHKEVPETQPKWLRLHNRTSEDEQALCYRAALEWAASNTQSGCRLADWLLIGKAKSDRNLIDICRAIYAAEKGRRRRRSKEKKKREKDAPKCIYCEGYGYVGDPHHGHSLGCERCGGTGKEKP